MDLTNEIVKIKSDGTKVVDLNEVVISKGIMRDKQIENGDKEEESFSPKKRRKQLKEGVKSTGLVSFLDDIPEKVFQSMLKGDTRLEDLNEDEFSKDNPMATIPNEETKNSMVALILAPTRELALQVKSHLEAVAKYTKIQVIECAFISVCMYYLYIYIHCTGVCCSWRNVFTETRKIAKPLSTNSCCYSRSSLENDERGDICNIFCHIDLFIPPSIYLSIYLSIYSYIGRESSLKFF